MYTVEAQQIIWVWQCRIPAGLTSLSPFQGPGKGGSVGNLRLPAADLGIGTLAPSHHQGGADTVKWSGSAEAGIQF